MVIFLFLLFQPFPGQTLHFGWITVAWNMNPKKKEKKRKEKKNVYVEATPPYGKEKKKKSPGKPVVVFKISIRYSLIFNNPYFAFFFCFLLGLASEVGSIFFASGEFVKVAANPKGIMTREILLIHTRP